ncbi:hypothetical protein ACFL1G_01780 [Planctomycetota bacterium]
MDRKTDSKCPSESRNQAENDTTPLPSDLTEIVAVWPKLSEHIKQAIKALVKTVKG